MLRNPFPITVLVLLALILSATGARAVELPPQLAVPPEEQAEAFLKGVSARVALTPQEVAAVRPILVEQTRKRQEVVRARLAANPGMVGMLALREDMRALGQETDDKLAAVLPPEKMAAVRAFREERRQQARSQLKGARRDG